MHETNSMPSDRIDRDTTTTPNRPMRYVKIAELEVALGLSPIEACIVSQNIDGTWIVTIRVKNARSQLLEDYQLLSTRSGVKKVWKDPRAIFRMLKDQYGIKNGIFQL